MELTSDPRPEDWRIGLAVKPKLKSHPYHMRIGIVRRINPKTAHAPETMYVEIPNVNWESEMLDEPIDEWMTA